MNDTLMFPIFDPARGAIAKGMMTSGGQSSIPYGFHRYLKNLRINGQRMIVRDATTKISASAVPGSGTLTCLASSIVTLNGTDYCIVARARSGGTKTSVYTFDLSAGTWTEISASSGQFGDTQFSTDTEFVWLAVVSDKNAQRDYLVIQNGKRPPRVWDPTDSTFAVHLDIPAPIRDSQLVPVFGDTGYWTIYNTSHTFSSTDSGGTAQTRFRLLDDASGTVDWILLDINDNVTKDDKSNNSVAFTAVDTTISGKESRQIHIWFRGDSGWINSIKISVSEDNSTYDAVHSPLSSTDAPSSKLIVSDSGNDEYILVCYIDHIPPDRRNALAYMKFQWVAESYGGGGSALYDVKIIGLTFGGQVPATSSFAMSWVGSGGKSETSASIQNVGYGKRLVDMGGSVVYQTTRYPLSPDILTYPQLYFTTIHEKLRDLGIDYVNFYRSDPGESLYYFIQTFKMATYSGGAWTWSDGTSTSPFKNLSTYDNTPPQDKQFSRVRKEEGDQSIPIAHTGAVIGHRMWCGDVQNGSIVSITYVYNRSPFTYIQVDNLTHWKVGAKITISGIATAGWTGLNGTWDVISVFPAVGGLFIGINYDPGTTASSSTSGTGTPMRLRGDIYFSKRNEFTWFAKAPKTIGDKIVETYPSRLVVSEDTIMGFSGLSVVGSEHLVILTNKNAYFTGGARTSELEHFQFLGPHGTLSYRSILRHNLDLYWVDQYSQVRRFTLGRIDDSLSRHVIDSELTGSADITKLTGGVYRDRLYLGYVPSGGSTNTQALVWDRKAYELNGPGSGWTYDVFPSSSTAEIFFTGVISGEHRLYYFSSDGHIYRHDWTTGGDLGGSTISVSWTTREMSVPGPLFGRGVFKRLAWVGNAFSGGVLTVSWTEYPFGNTFAGEIKLDALSGGYPRVAVKSRMTSTPKSYEGQGFLCTISGSLPARYEIQYVAQEIEPRDGDVWSESAP